MKLLIIVRHRFELWQPPEWFVERLRRDFAEVKILRFQDYAQAEAELGDADVLVTWSLRPEQFARARKLRWVPFNGSRGSCADDSGIGGQRRPGH